MNLCVAQKSIKKNWCEQKEHKVGMDDWPYCCKINENTVGIIAQLVNHDLESMNRLSLASILRSCRV